LLHALYAWADGSGTAIVIILNWQRYQRFSSAGREEFQREMPAQTGILGNIGFSISREIHDQKTSYSDYPCLLWLVGTIPLLVGAALLSMLCFSPQRNGRKKPKAWSWN